VENKIGEKLGNYITYFATHTGIISSEFVGQLLQFPSTII